MSDYRMPVPQQSDNHSIDQVRGHVQVYLTDGSTMTITDLGGLSITSIYLQNTDDVDRLNMALMCWVHWKRKVYGMLDQRPGEAS